jgi:DNA polymerase I-like protein with 3'-5' exonuclease and polymerase domains
MISTKRDDLKEAADLHPFVRQLLEFRESEKLLKAFVGKLAKPVVHPSFDVLARTGRTTSFGDINAQNLPRESAVRDCIIPHPGNVFIDADYETVEMATLSQVCIGQFGYESKMAAAINADLDLHRLVAAKMLGKHVDDVTDDERQKAKAVNFGKPGGMTDATLTRYAAVNYRVNLTAEETAELSRSWFELFPEMHQFLEKENVVPQRLAELLALTPASYRQATGEDRFGFLSDQVDAPLDTLGMMLIKAVGHRDPTTDRGRRYSAEEISYFFGHVETVIDRLPAKLQKSVRAREPSKRLQGAVMSLADRAAVFTLTGRLRANASYTARHNTVFQGLAADGAKLALWRIWRAGYRIANFIHDQVLVEVPRGSDLKHHADTVRQLMVDGMREVVPDVKISVAYAASERWFKGAKAVFDETGSLLLPWSPPQTTSNGSAEA